MVRKTLRIAALAVITAGIVVIASSASKAAAAAGIEEIMKKSFNKKVGVFPKIGPAVKEGKWEDAQKYAKTLAEGGAALPATTCPQGDAKSWEKLTKKFAVETKAVADATAQKDATAVEAALKALNASCKACHDAHRN